MRGMVTRKRDSKGRFIKTTGKRKTKLRTKVKRLGTKIAKMGARVSTTMGMGGGHRL